jgi:hypothetical protein
MLSSELRRCFGHVHHQVYVMISVNCYMCCNTIYLMRAADSKVYHFKNQTGSCSNNLTCENNLKCSSSCLCSVFCSDMYFMGGILVTCGLVANVCGLRENSIPYKTILSYSFKVNMIFKHGKKAYIHNCKCTAQFPPSNWHFHCCRYIIHNTVYLHI